MLSSSKQRRVALFAGLLNLTLFGLVLPSSKAMLAEVPAFLPSFITAILLFDLLTSFLLFSQFRVNRAPAQAVLAATYLYSGLITIPHILTFPGVFTANGLLHAGPQTAVWLWVSWHAGFPLGILTYALMEKFTAGQVLNDLQVRKWRVALMVAVPLFVAIITLWTTLGHDSLPIIVKKGNYQQLWDSGVGPVVLALNITAFFTTWIITRGRTVLQVWVSVSIFALLIDVVLTLFSGARYSLGWYVARANSVLSASIILTSLLIEISMLYLKNAEQEQRIKQQAHYDALTGLPNRYLFTEHLQKTLDQTAMLKCMAAVLFIDLDGFKQVNDTYGHDMGDLLLVEVAHRLQGCIRSGDMVARMGGDEFTVILQRLHEQAEAELVAGRVLQALERPVVIQGEILSISASVGVSVSPDDGADSDSLMKQADQAMYRAKEAGKNRFVTTFK